jgi:hypothetical protein
MAEILDFRHFNLEVPKELFSYIAPFRSISVTLSKLTVIDFRGESYV